MVSYAGNLRDYVSGLRYSAPAPYMGTCQNFRNPPAPHLVTCYPLSPHINFESFNTTSEISQQWKAPTENDKSLISTLRDLLSPVFVPSFHPSVLWEINWIVSTPPCSPAYTTSLLCVTNKLKDVEIEINWKKFKLDIVIEVENLIFVNSPLISCLYHIPRVCNK